MSWTIQYTIDPVDTDSLWDEIEAETAITKALEDIRVYGTGANNTTVQFDLELLGAEITALDAVVLAHAGTPPTVYDLLCLTCFEHIHDTGLIAPRDCPFCGCLDCLVEFSALAKKSNIVYVDAYRTDAYLPDGTELRPYKTYYDAVVTITDNSPTNRYVIKILGKTTEPDLDLPIKSCVFIEGYEMQASVIKVQPLRSLIWDARDGEGQDNGYTAAKDVTISRTDYSTTDLIKILRTTITPADNWCIFEIINSSIRGDVVFHGKGMSRDYFQVYNSVFLAGTLDIKNCYTLYHGVSSWGNSKCVADNPTYDYYGYGCYYFSESSQFYGTTHIETIGAGDGLYAMLVGSCIQGATTIDKVANSSLYLEYDSVSRPQALTETGNPTHIPLTKAITIDNDSNVSGGTVKDALNTLLDGVVQSDVILAGETPVDDDVSGWADKDKGHGIGTTSREFYMVKRGTTVKWMEMTV